MNKKIIFILLIILLPLVIGVPPVTQTAYAGGISISYPNFQYVAQGAEFDLTIVVSNLTSFLTNITTSCELDIYNNDGTNICKNLIPFEEGNFMFTISSGNFSTNGVKAWNIRCNNSNQVGFVNGVFEVNMIGEELTEGKALSFGFTIFILIFLFIACTVLIFKLPDGDNYNEQGELISISSLKYIRPILFACLWFLLLMLTFVSSNVLIAYFVNASIGNIIFTIYKIMMSLTLPMVVIWFIFLFYGMFKDRTMKRYLERGWEE